MHYCLKVSKSSVIINELSPQGNDADTINPFTFLVRLLNRTSEMDFVSEREVGNTQVR